MAKDNTALPYPLRVNGAKPLDYMYGPYESLTVAKTFIKPVLRYPGMTIGVIVAPNVIKEYWFNGGIADINLVEKQATDGQNIQSIKNRLEGIENSIPENTSEENPLVNIKTLTDKLSTDGAHYISKNGEPFSSYEELTTHLGYVYNNDYAFVKGVSDSGTVTYTRYKYNELLRTWAIEYVIDTSSFTPEELNDLQSTITGLLSDVASLKERVSALEQQGASGGDAESVNGYRIQVLFPQEFNIETARPDTIYLLLQTSQDTVVNIPSDITVNYSEVPYTPTKGNGWKFKNTPSPCTSAGTFLFTIEPEAGYVWNDGTKSDKILRVTVLEAVVTGWKFGDKFPIIFGNNSSPASNWKFGDSFPLMFQ